jgi:hypothetical protein
VKVGGKLLPLAAVSPSATAGAIASGITVGKVVPGEQATVNNKKALSKKYQYKRCLRSIDRIIARSVAYVNLPAVT